MASDSLPLEERTTPVGLYHFALSYRLAADFLRNGPTYRESTHPAAPRDFLYTHSIELYLKAYLRIAGFSNTELKKWGHDIPLLAGVFREKGGHLDDDERHVVTLLTLDNVFAARYIVTGAYRRATTDALAMTAESLHRQTRAAIRNTGEICSD